MSLSNGADTLAKQFSSVGAEDLSNGKENGIVTYSTSKEEYLIGNTEEIRGRIQSEMNDNLDDSGLLKQETRNSKHESCNSDSELSKNEDLESVRRLSDDISSLKLNPMAAEFRPPRAIEFGSVAEMQQYNYGMYNYWEQFDNRYDPRRQRRKKHKTRNPDKDSVKRTVYVCDIENSVTEEQLAGLFISCGEVIDCRICGDPNSTLRFAFVEFTSEVSATNALTLNGAVLNFQQLQVLPSKTSIVPVNPVYLPQSSNELEVCSRTVYVTNIDRVIDRKSLTMFFEQTCGSVSKSRVLGQSHFPTRIAFVEFARAESAMGALNCSGAILGKFPIRVSPSKTPVRLKKSASGNRSRSNSHSSDSQSQQLEETNESSAVDTDNHIEPNADV